jgi:hypothetical protein
MTLDDRIEAAARELAMIFGGTELTYMPGPATKVLQAAFPELFSSPPTGWIAPWRATEEMTDIDVEAGGLSYLAPKALGEAFEDMRDAYLNREGK